MRSLLRIFSFGLICLLLIASSDAAVDVYGYRSWRSFAAAQSSGIVSISPGAYQTPDSTPGVGAFTFAVNSPSNTGHAESAGSVGRPLKFQGLSLGPKHSGASSQGQDGVTDAQFAVALEAQKQADAKLTRGESAKRRFQELNAKLQRTGAVRIIVQLRVAFRPEGAMRQAAERLAQRAAIRQAQDKLLNGVHLRNPHSLKRFEYFPTLAFSVDAAGLAALRSSSQVIDVYEDVAIPVAQAQSPSIALIGAPNAWASGYTGAGKTIAILDTGVDKNHPSLSGKVVSEACYSTYNPEFAISPLCPGGVTQSVSVDSGRNCTVTGECAHGTKVAGVAAGVAPGATLISIQVNSLVNDFELCLGAAPCILTFSSDLMKGLERVFALRMTYSIASVNIGLSSGEYTSFCDSISPMTVAINQLRSVGIATVVASGNNSYVNALGFPACVSSAVSVGATGDGNSLPAGNVAPFSNSASFLSLLAPGYFTSAPIPGGGFNNAVGTSVSAAHVSGAWAILKQLQPAATVSEVLDKLKNFGVNVTDPRNGIIKPRIKIDSTLNSLLCFTGVPPNSWKGEYFSNISPSGAPSMVRNDGVGFLNFDFGLGSPGAACGLGVDNFSVRWTRTVNFAAGTYRFSVTGDDGVKLYVDGEVKIDKWVFQGATTYTADVTFNSTGSHQVKLEYFEGGGPGVAILSWANVNPTGVNCLPSLPLPLISNAPQTGGSENIASTAPSQAPKRCGHKNSD